jgi:hypothetical protein
MSKRLQVVVADSEFDQYARDARVRGVTLSEWVRQTLRSAERDVSYRDPGAKLAAVRAATRYNFPTADIDTMLAQIEQGYSAGSPDDPH